jgi:nucleoside-diphosphate-sugar epimerase
VKFGITGGAGFVGSNIAKLLIKQGHDVIIVDNLHTGKKENISEILDQVSFFNADIRDYKKIEKILNSVDGIFHEAALTIVQESFSKPKEYHDVNVVGTENILKIGKEFNLKVVFASSSSVYGNVKSIPITEKFSCHPINPYGQTKLDDEFLAKKYSEDGLKVMGLRYFNIYGRGQTGTYAGVITKFMNQLENCKSPMIFGDGKQLRDFIFVEDVAEANLAAMESSIKYGFFNIGTGITTTIQDLANLMIKLYNLEVKPEYLPSLKGDVKSSQSDIELSSNSLNWKFKTSLENGLTKMLKNNRKIFDKKSF